MTFNNIPKNLVDDLCGCMDRIEVAIRADERQRLLDRFRAEFPDKPVAKPKPETLHPITDMHGHPLHETGPQPVTYNDMVAPARAAGLCETHRRLISRLSEGTFYAVPTLAGHLGIKKESVYHYLSGIKRAGYELEIRNTGNRKGGYTHIYRLAKTG
jgi:biotin operon repressor